MPNLLQLTRGGTFAAVLGALLHAGALIVGLTTGTSILLFPVAAIAGVAFMLIPDSDRRAQALGAMLGAAAAGGWGAVTGFGSVEVAMVTGGLAAATTLTLIHSVDGRRVPFVGLAIGALALVLLNLVPLVLDGGGLNHDESAYALKAKSWLEGTPETGWNLHRGIAMSAYGYLILGSGGQETGLRFLGLAAISGLVAATWLLGNKVGGRLVGPLSALGVVAGPALLRRSTEYLSDIPSAALLVASMVIIWREFEEKPSPTYRLLWLLPLAWLAFYLRYQSVLSLGLIGMGMLILWWDKIRLRAGPIVLTAAIGLIGLIPHFVFSTSETGSPIGILQFTGSVAGRDFFGEGFFDYAMLMAWPLSGFVGPVAAMFLVWWTVVGWQNTDNRTRALFLLIPAAGQVLVLGALSHGESRFVFFPLALTVVGGVTGFVHLRVRWRRRTVAAASLGLIILLLGSLALSVASVRRSVENRALATEPVELAAATVSLLSVNSCGVMTSYLPQITYYSECFTGPFRLHLDPSDALARVSGESKYMVLIEDGKRQPQDNDLDELVALTTGDATEIHGERDSAEVYEFEP